MSKKSHRRNSNNSKPPKKIEEVKANVPTSNPNEVLESEVKVPDTVVVNAEEANKKPYEYAFFSRVFSIPLIREGSSIVQQYANQNSISRYALTTAKSTIEYAASVAMPYAEKFQSQLSKVDQLGCQSLDFVEAKFPVVTREPNQIINSVKESPQKVYQDVKGTLLIPVTCTATSLHSLVNKYLPPTSDQERSNDDVKLSTLANEVKERLTRRVTTQLQHSRADISRLAETNLLLQEAFQSIQKANTRLQDFIVSLKGTPSKANQRIHELTADLIARLDAAAAYVKEHHHNLPSSVQVVVDPLVSFATNEYEIVRNEVLKPDVAPLQKATNILHLTQEYVLPLIQRSIQGVEEQVRQYKDYANNSRVIQDVKSTFGFVKVKVA